MSETDPRERMKGRKERADRGKRMKAKQRRERERERERSGGHFVSSWSVAN